jgi:hypothetical protein
MSEPIPESIPTSMDRRSHRPTKKRALTPSSAQSAEISSLMANPDKQINLPSTSVPKTSSSLAPPPEIVANVQGSSAGAGSGEFHVYKASRRREYERVRLMEDEAQREKEDAEFEKKMEEMKKRDEEKTGKNRKRREKAKVRKGKGKKGGDGNGDGEGMDIVVEKMAGRNGAGGSNSLDKAANQKDTRSEVAQPTVEKDTNGQGVSNPEEIGVIIHDDD